MTNQLGFDQPKSKLVTARTGRFWNWISSEKESVHFEIGFYPGWFDCNRFQTSFKWRVLNPTLNGWFSLVSKWFLSNLFLEQSSFGLRQNGTQKSFSFLVLLSLHINILNNYVEAIYKNFSEFIKFIWVNHLKKFKFVLVVIPCPVNLLSW